LFASFFSWLWGMAGIDLADHQKFTMPCLLAAQVVMTIACVLFGLFPSDRGLR
jgi:Mg2+/citrate symporter